MMARSSLGLSLVWASTYIKYRQQVVEFGASTAIVKKSVDDVRIVIYVFLAISANHFTV